MTELYRIISFLLIRVAILKQETEGISSVTVNEVLPVKPAAVLTFAYNFPMH